MALASFFGKVDPSGAASAASSYSDVTAAKTATAAAVTAAPSTTAVAAAIGVLVADGASPTQAHVTTLNSAWTTLLAAIVAQVALVSTADTAAGLNDGTNGVSMTIDLAKVATATVLRKVLSALEKAAVAAGALTL